MIRLPVSTVSGINDASEIIVCFPHELSADLLDGLEGILATGKRIEFQSPKLVCIETIVTLLKRGYRVFEGKSLQEPHIFFDRRQAFPLPRWKEVPDAYDLACKLVWSRIASFRLVQGTLLSINSLPEGDLSLLQLAKMSGLSFTLATSEDMPSIGRHVEFLVRNDFGAGRSILLQKCIAVL